MKPLVRILLAVAGLALVPCPAAACSLCQFMNGTPPATFRQDLESARMVLYGTIANPRLTAGGAGTGVSDFHIKTVLKSDPWLGSRKVLEVPRYLPVSNPKDPPKYLLFCDVYQGKPDIFRGVPVKSDAGANYVEGLLALKGKATVEVLRYCFDYLEHPDPELAADAFLEFAKAKDQDIGEVAPKLSADRLRRWLKHPQTPEARLGLYAFLLGACGTAEDAALLRSMVQEPTDRTRGAIDGLLGGYIQLRPQEGWSLALAVLRDARQPFAARFAVVRMLRFYYTWKPRETADKVREGLGLVLQQSDIADLAVEDLRRWQMWDMTGEVLRLYGQKGYDAPLMERAIVRYALSCPKPEAAKFVDEVRKKDAELVKDVEESLQLEKK